MEDPERLLARRAAVVPAGLPRLTDVVVQEARGESLIDPSGRVRIDLAIGRSIDAALAGLCEELTRVAAGAQKEVRS